MPGVTPPTTHRRNETYMPTELDKEKIKQKPIGADLVIPVLAIGFTIYYLSTTWNLRWEAKMSGLAVGGVLLILIAILLVRTALQVKRGKATLGMGRLLQPLESQSRRFGLIAAIVAFIAALPYLGFTLAIFCFMCSALLILGVRKPLLLLVTAFSVATGGYVGFIVILNTRFPHGLVEKILARIF
ncbi:MAG: tripartite tricarboxylate transporter TctB family protein [Thermodesulfobacteriota bacterium]|nr:tripartite tricarboxylate transporter TctB family protein [Thermodesulfobacteriota bacterium]